MIKMVILFEGIFVIVYGLVVKEMLIVKKICIIMVMGVVKLCKLFNRIVFLLIDLLL